MIKINVLGIVSGHLRTIRSAESNKFEKDDLIVFFAIPIVGGLTSYYFGITLKNDVFNTSISVFSIFSALLLNVQIALFSIYQRNWGRSNDEIVELMQKEDIGLKKRLLSELNTNISYMVLFSIVSVILFVIFYSFEFAIAFRGPVTVFIYLHFVLTLMMVVKRSHALFQKEYDLEQ
ncbi:hypothetical protein QBK99_21005 [Corticibacterium sp. UT-5YL-CI-8]|nr:hypothetical protein [Tianweitania sp. UT-5YL-CI-8]